MDSHIKLSDCWTFQAHDNSWIFHITSTDIAGYDPMAIALQIGESQLEQIGRSALDLVAQAFIYKPMKAVRDIARSRLNASWLRDYDDDHLAEVGLTRKDLEGDDLPKKFRLLESRIRWLDFHAELHSTPDLQHLFLDHSWVRVLDPWGWILQVGDDYIDFG